MTASALALMLFSMTVLWGGLVVAVIHLVRSGRASAGSLK